MSDDLVTKLETEDVAVEPARQQPGALLRSAREERGYSVGDITQALKFSARQVEALEKDDYAGLPGTTFLRGMVRSYARYLKLDDVALLALLQPEVQPTPEVNEPAMLGDEMPRDDAASSPIWRKIVPLLILLAIIAGAWYAWQWRQTHRKDDKSEDAVGLASALVNPKPQGNETVTPVAPPQPQIQNEVPVAAPTVAPVAPAAPDATVAAPAPAAAPAAAAVEAPPAVAAPPQLVFNLGEKSWIEVRDANRKTVMRGEYPANSRQVASGQAPFQVVIGNALHVRVQYGERNIDLQPYTYATVARLTVQDK